MDVKIKTAIMYFDLLMKKADGIVVGSPVYWDTLRRRRSVQLIIIWGVSTRVYRGV
ncbi:MAG: hypothetical protein LBG15_06890 [Dysgonamonadaceae bacterium]|nr:hypothetical protein [Dysgonamonadaceae bacterium]